MAGWCNGNMAVSSTVAVGSSPAPAPMEFPFGSLPPFEVYTSFDRIRRAAAILSGLLAPYAADEV